MSKRRDKPAAPAAPVDPYPSASVLHELMALVKKGLERPALVRAAWPLIATAAGNNDFGVVSDFAQENDLVAPLEVPRPDGQPSRYPTWTNPVDGSEMVWIPPGPFFVGADKKTAAESQGFSLARHPVTNAQFAQFLAETGYTPSDDHPDPETFLSHWSKGKPPGNRENHPVVWVSFLDALHYCKWAGATLPSEWLWEKAARGPDGRRFPWGDESPGPRRGRAPLANVASSGTCAVGSYPRTRTPYGCEDLVGNVSEWCQPGGDDLGQFPPPWPTLAPGRGQEVAQAAVRGACFMRSTPTSMVAWHRRRLSVARRNYWVGFRPAVFLPFRSAV
jgi:formylglycine-generating enzyme required for sulfatase activity